MTDAWTNPNTSRCGPFGVRGARGTTGVGEGGNNTVVGALASSADSSRVMCGCTRSLGDECIAVACLGANASGITTNPVSATSASWRNLR